MEENGHGSGRSRLAAVAPAVLLAFFLLTTGCSAVQDFLKTDVHRFLAPDKVIRPPSTGSPINPIYSSIGPADTAQELVPNATPPSEEDLVYSDADYLLGPSDLVNISVLDLFYEGVETPLQRPISPGGTISLPLVEKKILAEGLTVDQLRDEIVKAYRPEILKSPIVSVTIAARRTSLYSVMGAVAAPQRYSLYRKDFRLLDALSAAGGVAQPNIRYVYVIRQAPPVRQRTLADLADKRAGELTKPERLPELPPEAPPEQAEAKPEEPRATQPTIVPSVPAERPDGPVDIEKALKELGALEAEDRPAKEPETAPSPEPDVLPALTELAQTGPSAAAPAPVPQNVESLVKEKPAKFVYTAEGWVRVEQDEQPATRPLDKLPGPTPIDQQQDPFGWRQMGKSSLSRIIAINYKKLKNGDWRQNIVIRENDIISVPSHEVGEFYVMGEVLRPGVYSLTGRQLTIKQGIAAAGNFAPLAWPKNAVLYRRVGNSQEQTIPVDLEAIFRGEEPDTFLKPNDILAVGTDVRASFYAVMRNAFRMTYGFGLIYDRNFADPYFLTLDSKRFTRF